MRGMELMGYLSNSGTLDSIYLINKKHIGNIRSSWWLKGSVIESFNFEEVYIWYIYQHINNIKLYHDTKNVKNWYTDVMNTGGTSNEYKCFYI